MSLPMILQLPLYGHHVCPGCDADMDTDGELCRECQNAFEAKNALPEARNV